MNQKTYSQILEDVAHEGLPADLNLAPQIIARVQKGKSATMQLRKRMIVILLVLVMLLMTATVVAAAVQHWFGYVPGFGLVRDGQLRELAEPVSISQNGFTLKVEKGILSSEKTQVMYSLDGVTAEMQLAKPTCIDENSSPFLRLPDGRKLESSGLMDGLNPYEANFAPMPAEVNEATLVINCIERTSPELVPQHWEVPLRFMAASPALTVAPVLEVPATIAPTAVATLASPLFPTTQPVIPQGGLTLKTVVQTLDGYILAGTIMVTPPAGYTVEKNYGDFLKDVTVTDAGGQVLVVDIAPNEFTNSMLQSASPEEIANYWDCQVYGKNIRWPLTMTIHSLTARGPLLPQAEFQFDAGSAPKADQVWILNQDVILGTKTAHIVSVRRIKGGLSGYEFTLVDDPALYFWPEIKGHQIMGGGGVLNADGTSTRVLAYPEPLLPTGMLTVLVNGNELIQLPGPWQATWQEPLAAGSTSTP